MTSGTCRDSGTWSAVTVACEPGFEDIVSTCIFESGFSGFEEHTESGGTVFTAYYNADDTYPTPASQLKDLLTTYTNDHTGAPGHVLSESEVPREDWETSWREGLGAVEIGSRLLIRPSWVPAPRTAIGKIDIVIDPKMAFGTGGHVTTVLCLEALLGMYLKGAVVLDAGCGSGVLCIAAAKLGAHAVLGVDTDPFSVDNARENITLNETADIVDIREADCADLATEQYDIVLANMLSGIIIPRLPAFRSLVKPGGTTVFSGILAEELDMFLEALDLNGYQPADITSRDEWIALEVR